MRIKREEEDNAEDEDEKNVECRVSGKQSQIRFNTINQICHAF